MKEQILEAIEKKYNSPELQEYIEKKAEESLKNIINTAFGRYGYVTIAMEKQISEKLSLSNKVTIPQYNDLIIKMIERQFSKCLNEAGLSKIEENMKKLLQTAPAEIKLSELVNEMKSYDDSDGYYGKEATCIIEGDEEGGYRSIYLDPSPLEERSYTGGISKYDAKIRIGINTEGIVYSLTVDGADQKDVFFTGPFYGFEKLLFNLYANGSKLIVDETDINLHYD